MSNQPNTKTKPSHGRKAVIRPTEADARANAHGQYRAYRVTGPNNQEVFVTAVNPAAARGIAAERWGIVAHLLTSENNLTKESLVSYLAQLPEAERRAIFKESGMKL